MPSTTPNYGLHLYDRTSDTGEYFLDYRDDIAGTGSTSNMYKIDTQMKINADGIATKVTKTTAGITYYVNGSTGSDITGDGTSGNPFETIQHAIDILPKYLEHVVLISVSNGTYAEDVDVAYFTGENLQITSTGGYSTLDSITIYNTTAQITITSIKVITASSFVLWSASDVKLISCVVQPATYTAGYGFYIRNYSQAYIYTSVVDNCTYGVGVETGGFAYVESTSGTGNNYAYICNAGMINYSSSSIAYTVAERSIFNNGLILPFDDLTIGGDLNVGGIIYVGSATGLYIPDNTDLYFGDSADFNIRYNSSADRLQLSTMGTLNMSFLKDGSTLIPDNEYLEFGDDEDVYMGFNGTELGIYNPSANTSMYGNGSQLLAKFFYSDNHVELYKSGVKKFETTATGATVTGILATTGGVSIPDDTDIYMGTGSDFSIRWDTASTHHAQMNLVSNYLDINSVGNGTIARFGYGINAYIEIYNASFVLGDADYTNYMQFKYDGTTQVNTEMNMPWHIVTDTPETIATFTPNGSVDLYYNGVKKLETDNAGITVSGNIIVSGTVDGIDIATDVAANTLKVTNATHSGDVTGATELTIANSAVTLAKMANMATASLIYRKTAGDGAPEVNTLATLKTDLGLTGTNSGNETTTTIGALVNGATAKTTPVDADMIPLMDSAASNIIKKLSWANIKATLKTYFDSLTTTLTNKRITKRVYSTTSLSTLTVASDSYDIAKLTAQAASLIIANPTGTPTDGQPLEIWIKDNGTARTITSFGTNFNASTDLPVPTTTIAGKWMHLGFKYNSTTSKWDFLAYLDNL